MAKKLRGTVTFVAEPVWKAYVEVTVPGDGWPHGIHRLVYGFQTPQGVQLGDELDLEYVSWAGGALWFARKT